jgi:hypothetical protein
VQESEMPKKKVTKAARKLKRAKKLGSSKALKAWLPAN